MNDYLADLNAEAWRHHNDRLRDEFAMAALSGLIDGDILTADLARMAYEVADAMMTARISDNG
jgi:hypothetical protein